MSDVIVYEISDIMSLFSQGMVAGVFFGSICFMLGFVINFLLSLVSDNMN